MARRSLDAMPRPSTVRGFTRWNAGGTACARSRHRARAAMRGAAAMQPQPQRPRQPPPRQVFEFPVAASSVRAAYVAGTFDTKGRELFFLRQCLEKLGMRVVTVDLSTSGKPSPASVHPREVARHHPQGESAVFSGDRGSAVDRDGARLRAFLRTRRDLGGIISAGGSGGTSMATQGMRALPIGVPEDDGLDHGQRRHAALRRPERHLHDVFGDRRAGHQPHQRAGAGQRGERAGRHDRAPARRQLRRPPSRPSASRCSASPRRACRP